ncbi:MAG TPA: homoserine dehydrogenase [Terriglobales bacterium]|nr:homoserine dehydrogenase [Terriglobales bacterium]
MCNRLIVLKFGSSVLRSEADLPRAVHEIYRWLRDGHSVVAVVSAFGKTTDQLLASAREYSDYPPEGALALLLSTGEKRAAALLALALDRAGIPSTAFDPSRLGLRTSGRVLNAEPVRLNVGAIRKALGQSRVAVVPGFIGQMQDGRTSLLGRGGSDLSALFLATQINARCRLLKDVDGVYDDDPHVSTARCYASITWEDASAIGGRIIQAKALRFAREHGQTFEVASLGSDRGTVVGAKRTQFVSDVADRRQVRAALLGLGTVGYGVYQELAAHPESFEVVGIAVRTLHRPEQRVPQHLLSTNVWDVVERDCDIVVEALGSVQPAADCIERALRAGKHVVTANKAALASNPYLFDLARKQGVKLLCSAAVGGAVPVLETVERLSRECGIESVQGVLNGTTNFLLHDLALGIPFEQTLAQAQAFGLAEADPSADLNGSDVACKLALIARFAFGCDLPVSEVKCTGITDIDPRHVFDLSKSGSVVRLVGSLWRRGDSVLAEVKPVVLEASSPLANTQREENSVVIKTTNGETYLLHGKGAGCWPTREAVFADVLTLLQEKPTRSQTETREFRNTPLIAVAAAGGKEAVL